ncbi:artemin isoform X1 [Monodelphis domestica]|uniref:artemin isoform X1 n=1 Tax=Monodelphis domestica TaxID=13616 RepID=UPI0024E26E92|nr:artemin isoform X1 [Monodelphis domestica]XP_056671245.1 artemin isoform X1 [Monodelphis domestica]
MGRSPSYDSAPFLKSPGAGSAPNPAHAPTSPFPLQPEPLYQTPALGALLVLMLMLCPALCSPGPRVPLAGALSPDGRVLPEATPGSPQLLRERVPEPMLLPLLKARAQGRAGQRRKGQSRSRSQGRRRAQECHLHTELVKVHELGLGHDSDELIRFQYCSGACPKVRSNHDISLAHLLRSGRLRLPAPPGGGSVRVLSHPCCRPTAYKAVSFMDVSNTWRTVDSLSAAACGCLG